MRNLLALAIAVAIAALGGSGALAAKRVALVVGNDSYRELPALGKAGADAEAFAAAMGEQNFDRVILKRDLDRAGMDAAISEFLEVIEPGDTAVFFFSGHGWSDGAQNYLVGIDAPKTGSETHLARISIPLQNGANGIIDEIERKGAALKVAIIDACRDNPFLSPVAGKSVGRSRGLTAVQAPSGTFIVFSAGAGQVALDALSDEDPDPNGVFTRTFLPLVRAQLPLHEAIKSTQQRVYELALQVGHTQEPAYYDQVRGTACLSEACNGTAAEVPIQVVTQAPPAPTPTVPADEKFYEAALAVGTCGAMNAFIDQYPSSPYASLARENASILCAPPPEPESEPEPVREAPGRSFGGGTGTYFVIFASVPHGQSSEAERVLRSLSNQGVDAYIIDTDDYSNLKDGLYSVVVGPFSRQEALNALPYAQQYVGDAYVKSGS